MWQADRSPDAPGRLENLKELVVAMAEFENLGGFLEHVSLVMDNAADSGGDMVNLMTLHSAKGLEFDTVFLPGWEEGVFPSQRSIEENGLAGLEEERRLAYVGLTRARRRALCVVCRQPAHPRPMADLGPLALCRRAAERPDRDGDRAGPRPAAPAGPPSPAANAAWGSTLAARATDGTIQKSLPRPPLVDRVAAAAARRRRCRRVGGFAVGDRVFHQKFGYGTIRAVEDNKLEIDFDKAGDKKVMDAFVERA